MGIQVEFNPDLALRHIDEHVNGSRSKAECIPLELEVDKVYYFLKKGQRNYWLEGEIPLVETKGNQDLSSPLASVVILYATHRLIGKVPWTEGMYKVIEVYPRNDSKVHFNGFAKID